MCCASAPAPFAIFTQAMPRHWLAHALESARQKRWRTLASWPARLYGACDRLAAARRPAARASPLAPQIMEVSEEEFVKVPGYLRGRATLARVNDAVVDINAGAATKAKLCGTKMSKLNDANQSKVWAWRDAERSTEELSGGRGFIFESDLRGGVIKAGASGRELLIILRHLGRLKEISTPTGEKALMFLK